MGGEARIVAVNFKGKNETFVPLTQFPFFLITAIYLNFNNGVNGKFEKILNGSSHYCFSYYKINSVNSSKKFR